MKGLSPAEAEMHKRAIAALPTAGSKRKALLLAGAAESTATTQSTRTFKRIARNPENAEFLARGKINEARLGKKLSALLDATILTKTGTVPDHAVQLRTAELCLKLGQHLKPGDDTNQVIMSVMQQIVPLVMPFVPPERHAELAEAVQAYGARENVSRA